MTGHGLGDVVVLKWSLRRNGEKNRTWLLCIVAVEFHVVSVQWLLFFFSFDGLLSALSVVHVVGLQWFLENTTAHHTNHKLTRS